MHHYKYHNQILAMDSHAIQSVFSALEGRSRTGEVSYLEKPQISQAQLADIKNTWPSDLLDLVKAKIAEIAPNKKVDGEITYEAIKTVLMAELPKRRSAEQAIATSTRYLERNVLSDIALSMTLGIAPNVGNEQIRTIGGKKIGVRILISSIRMVVNDTEVDNADIHVAAMVNDHASRAVLIGWATKEDLRGAHHGNKLTDPDNCSWSRMSFWIEIGKLRPMIDLMRTRGVKNGSAGFVLESVPNTTDLPILDERLDGMIQTDTKAKDDYYSILGMDDPITTIRQEPQQEEKDASDDFQF